MGRYLSEFESVALAKLLFMETTTLLKDRRIIVGLSVFIAGGVFLFLLMSLGFGEIFGKVLELESPSIHVTTTSHGLSLAGSSMEVKFVDKGSGLDNYKIGIKQVGGVPESVLSSGNLKGAHEHTLRLVLPGIETSLSQGEAKMSISVSDRSLWGSSSTYEYTFQIDLDRPAVQLVNVIPEVLQGGAYLLVARVADNLQRVDMGLRVGSHIFKSYPAKGLDRAFDDPNLYVIPFTYPLDEDPTVEIPIVFAEDVAGNGVTIPLKSLKIMPRQPVEVDVNVTQRYLQDNVKQVLAENKTILDQFLGQLGGASFLPEDGRVGPDDFTILNEYLVPLFERRLYSQIAASRFDRYWFRPFFKPSGRVKSRFMALENYVNGDVSIGKRLSRGYVIELPSRKGSVQSLGDGVVMYTGNCGHNGECVAIDHGLGIVSVLGMLEASLVRVGERIEAGQIVGKGILTSGPEIGRHYYVELNVQGVSVEVRDWWNAEWFTEHISGVIGSVRRALGLAKSYKEINGLEEID
jgi:murein DD-endopeptidase MepM/ murein hydrolase activator NlpD